MWWIVCYQLRIIRPEGCKLAALLCGFSHGGSHTTKRELREKKNSLIEDQEVILSSLVSTKQNLV